ncbi:MAG: hypothetical protein IJJ43_05360, partial [Oscillospiraceae bacterium]|nr:hypothetical protein [Oscillospiraceae bacterium]
SLRSHTGGLRRVFCEVHAPAKNDRIAFAAAAAKELVCHCEAPQEPWQPVSLKLIDKLPFVAGKSLSRKNA